MDGLTDSNKYTLCWVLIRVLFRPLSVRHNFVYIQSPGSRMVLVWLKPDLGDQLASFSASLTQLKPGSGSSSRRCGALQSCST